MAEERRKQGRESAAKKDVAAHTGRKGDASNTRKADEKNRRGDSHPFTNKESHGGHSADGKARHAPRSDRSAPKKTSLSLCPVSKNCGGCKWINKPYEEQLHLKEAWVREQLRPYCKLEPIIRMEEPFHYRNKVNAVFGESKTRGMISGIYEEGTHRIVPLDSCLIEDQRADAIIVTIRGLLKSFKIRPYNEDAGFGLLRHVMVRTAHATGEIMVVLVLTSPVMPSKNNFVKALRERHPEITTIVVNVNDRDTSMVLGTKEQVIYGKGYIEDVLCGKRFRISPRSFYQVNSVQTEKLYAKALEYAALTGKETVVDAYCGTGTIGVIASDRAAQVIGVELNADAVQDARINARLNQAKNITFVQSDAGEFLVGMAKERGKADVVLLDPPRSGSDEAFLSSVVTLAPEKVVYISCNPETLARDLGYLVKGGYKVRKGVPVDMFPFTELHHVETVCYLSRK